MKNLKKLRENSGMSQQKLADKLFVTQQSIYKYENGLAFPTIDTLKLMSEIFDVSIDYIVENDNQDTVLDKRTKFSKEEEEVIYHYRKISPKSQKIVLDLLQQLL